MNEQNRGYVCCFLLSQFRVLILKNRCVKLTNIKIYTRKSIVYYGKTKKYLTCDGNRAAAHSMLAVAAIAITPSSTMAEYVEWAASGRTFWPTGAGAGMQSGPVPQGLSWLSSSGCAYDYITSQGCY